MRKVIEVRDMDEAVKVIENKVIPDICRYLLKDIEEEIVYSILNSVSWDRYSRYHLVYTGNLLKSVQVDWQKLEILIGVPYAQVLEFGSTKRFTPPFEPIRRWVELKLRIKNKKLQSRIAWAIVKKFSRQGFQPHPFVRPALHKIMKKWGGLVKP